MLELLQTGLSQVFSNKKFLLIMLLIIVLIAAAVYTYLNYISPRINADFIPNKEFENETNDVSTATLYFFYVDWCPYCKKAKPILEKLQEKYENQQINNITVNINLVDSTNDDSAVSQFEQEHNVKIDGYPTIYLVKGSEVIEYDAKVTEDSLTQYLNTVL